MQVDHTKNIVELKDISFSYGNEKVLQDISFNVHLGDYLGIIGPNGGGKTTLLKLLLGLLKPTSGEIRLFGQDIKNFRDWSKIGYVSQTVTQIDANFPMTVEGVVNMGLYAKRGLFSFPSQRDKQRVRQALQEVDMAGFSKRLIGDLSVGQKQRVFLARALAGNPELIILDEPTTAIDSDTQGHFYALLRKLNKELDLTLVLVSHDLDAIEKEATELACISKELVCHVEPKDFRNNKNLVDLYGKGIPHH